MAQKTGKEEMELKIVPEPISLCVKCAIAGVSSANNLCQKCFNAAAAASNAERSFRSGSNPRSSPRRKVSPADARPDLKEQFDILPVAREVNRCSGCRRKVGLTGFRCRCGDLFCADHRYTDRHSCSYDYKSAGREAIARENPLVKAAKIVKI